MENELALDLISVTKGKQGKEVSPWLSTGSHQYRIDRFIIAHTTMTRGPVNRHNPGSARAFSLATFTRALSLYRYHRGGVIKRVTGLI
jgi:hypothetical protein